MDLYKTILGDTFDKISLKVYGEEKYMPHLLRANPEKVETVIFPAGEYIVCPDIPLEDDPRLPPWKRGIR